MRVQIQDRLPDGIDFVRGNLVQNSSVRKLLARTHEVRIRVLRTGIVNPRAGRVGIVRIRQVRQALREVPGALQVRGHNPFNVDGIPLPGFFEIHEEERTVLDDGPAHREAVLVADVIGFFATC